MRKVWKDACKTLNPQMCEYCSEDDIGYCGLRRSDISDKDKFVQYCFPCFLKGLEKDAKL